MTDNEKRAHDLTIATIQSMTIVNGQSGHLEKPYEIYTKLYPKLLEQFEKDFPIAN